LIGLFALGDGERGSGRDAEHGDRARAERCTSRSTTNWPPRLTRSPQNHSVSRAGSNRILSSSCCSSS
jgi:hypothetical protein